MLAVQNKRIVRGSSRYDTNELETRLPWISISRFVSSNRRLLRCSFPFFPSLSLLSVSQGSVRAEGGRRREVSLRTRTRFLLSRSSLESRRRKKRIISGASFDHVPTGIFYSFFFPYLPCFSSRTKILLKEESPRTTVEYVIQLSCWIILISLLASSFFNYHLGDEWMEHSSIFFIFEIFPPPLSVF